MSGVLTASELNCNPSILLRNKGSAGSLPRVFQFLFNNFNTGSNQTLLLALHFEGRVGAVVFGGSYFVTSPNMDCVYNPPKNRRMTFKLDMRLGDDDCLQWPQPWTQDCPHYACIPRNEPKLSKSSPQYVLFYKPRDCDFELVQAGPVSGLGRLSSGILELVQSFMEQTVRPHFRRYTLSSDKDKTPIFANLYTLIRRAIVHLQWLLLTRTQVLFLFAELQRYLLEYVACKDYMEVYKLRMDGVACPGTQVDNVIGAFVQSVEHAEAFVLAGLPVWLVRPVEFASTVRVDAVVEPILARDRLCLDDAYHLFPVSFIGAATDINKYRTFADYSRSYLTYSNAFALPPPLSLPPSLTSAAGSALLSSHLAQPSNALGRNNITRSKPRPQPCKHF